MALEHKFKYLICIGLSLILNMDISKCFAQTHLPLQRQWQSQEKPLLPESEKPASPPFELPSVSRDPETNQLSEKWQIFVHKFQMIGNKVFSDEELSEIIGEFEGREISSEELQEVRQKLTHHYVDNGYINSGAVIPDQKVENSIVQIYIIEGEITEISLEGNKWLHSKYIKNRLAIGSEPALNVNQIEHQLQLLQQNPVIEQIHASLNPGINPGEGVLDVQIKERNPFQFGFTFANDSSPGVGSERTTLYAANRSLTRWHDVLSIQYEFTDSAEDFSVFYSRPINIYDTIIELFYQKGDTKIIEEPFKNLDIESDLETYKISLIHPLYKTPQKVFSLGLALDRRRSQTFLLGRPWSFSPGVQDGESTVSVLRFSQEWLDRSLNQVIAARSTISLGIDAFSATTGPEPDGQFLAWLGQFQWGRLLNDRGDQVLFRTDIQIAKESLLPLERICVGGAMTVRGYRENLLVRDNALITSLEFRIPIFQLPIPGLSRGFEDGRVQLAPFADFGWGWNTDLPTPDPKTISSIGIGVRWNPLPHLRTQLYWGKALRDVDSPTSNLQDSGIHFLLSFFSFL
jgi:hemolysin activation/secretion protein